MSFKRYSRTKTLTLKQRIQVIEEHEKKKLSAKQLTQKFNVGKTQIYNILSNRDNIRNEWYKGTSGNLKRLRRSTENNEINRKVYEWFLRASAMGMPLSGPIIQAEALEVAKALGKNDFKASNGWLESFRSRHNVSFSRVGGNDNSGTGHLQAVTICKNEVDFSCAELSTEDENIAFDGELVTAEEAGEDTNGLQITERDEDHIIVRKTEIVEEGEEERPKELKISSYSVALSVINDLQEFAASQNHSELMDVLQNAKDLVIQTVVKRPR